MKVAVVYCSTNEDHGDGVADAVSSNGRVHSELHLNVSQIFPLSRHSWCQVRGHSTSPHPLRDEDVETDTSSNMKR